MFVESSASPCYETVEALHLCVCVCVLLQRIVEAEAKIDEERATSKASWGRDVEFQNDPRLLPAIHGIWPSLAPLLRDVAGTADSHVVFSAALRVLVCLVECASSFIRNRFQKDVWPQMRRHLTQLLAWARPRMNLSPTANTRGIDVAVAEMLQSRSEESAVEARRIRERKASSAGVMLLARPGAGEVVERLQAPIAQNLLCNLLDFLKVAAQHQLELPGDVLRTITTVALDAMGTAHVQIVRESAYDLLRQLLRYQADSIWLQIAQAARCSRCEPNVAVQAQPQAREVFAPVVVCDVAKTADHDQVLCERAQRLLEFAANLPEPAPKEEFPVRLHCVRCEANLQVREAVSHRKTDAAVVIYSVRQWTTFSSVADFIDICGGEQAQTHHKTTMLLWVLYIWCNRFTETLHQTVGRVHHDKGQEKISF